MNISISIENKRPHCGKHHQNCHMIKLIMSQSFLPLSHTTQRCIWTTFLAGNMRNFHSCCMKPNSPKLKTLSFPSHQSNSYCPFWNIFLVSVADVVITKGKIQNIFQSAFLGNSCSFATSLLLLFTQVSLYLMPEN